MIATTTSGATPLGRLLTCIGLLWVAGIGLRVTILAVPPLIRLIHDDLHMSETEVGILSGLPIVLFVLAAVPGSLLIARLGATTTLVAGLLVTALGCVLRGFAPDFALLCAATVVTGLGVAVMQPALPPLVRAWLPDRIGFGTAVYTNGLLVGEILPVALTALVLVLVGGSWRIAFVVWAVPCAVIALLILGLAPRAPVPTGPTAPRRWWPDWRSGLIWRLGLMFGANNATYFSANAFIPDYLHHVGRPDLIGDTLSALNIGQLPASLILLACAGRLAGRAWPYVGCGLLSLVSVIGILSGTGWIIVAAAAALGFSGAATLTLLLALPPLLSPPEDIHRTTAAMFTISYSCAVIAPIISGLAWDASGIPAVAFAPIGLFSLLMIGLASTLPRPAR
ncbi:MAG: transporter, family, cyanate transporter [Alphaproteobacteria bacterium]|nr:transporter, family, cyanate transporter [Alphaproteobacteria bacterium]